MLVISDQAFSWTFSYCEFTPLTVLVTFMVYSHISLTLLSISVASHYTFPSLHTVVSFWDVQGVLLSFRVLILLCS
jgi:hypothetical protein